MSQPAAVETTTAHCFKCREKRTYTRLLASKPVFACDGCAATREIEELGRVEIPGRISPVPPTKRAPAPAPKTKRTYTNRRQETKTMSETNDNNKRSPLQVAIDTAVKEGFAEIRAELAEIKKAVANREDAGDALTDKDLDRKLSERFETEIPELVNRAVLQMLATPAKASASRKPRRSEPEAAADGSCRHKNFMRKCPSCQAKHADKGE